MSITTGYTVLYYVENKDGLSERAALVTAVRQNEKYDLVVFNPNGFSYVNRVSMREEPARGFFTRKECKCQKDVRAKMALSGA